MKVLGWTGESNRRRTPLAPIAGTPAARGAGTGPLLLGRAAPFVAAMEQVRAVAGLGIHVLLSGPSGSGKSVVARHLHEASPRAARPFLQVNCAALPESLLENELFGAVAGAHSTARSSVDGKIAAAEGGTLFLDEIAELAPTGQAKLLQFLESGRYFPLGATRPRSADVRIVAASNVDLHEAAAAGRFRVDLLYRLDVFPIRLPALAERVEDIAELAQSFCRESAQRHGVGPVRLDPAAIPALEAAPWPGNIRQLENRVASAVIRAAARNSPLVTESDLFPGTAGGRSADGPTLLEATMRFQASYLGRVLEESGWNVAACARRLGIARSHAYTLIRQFGLERKGPEGHSRGGLGSTMREAS